MQNEIEIIASGYLDNVDKDSGGNSHNEGYQEILSDDFGSYLGRKRGNTLGFSYKLCK